MKKLTALLLFVCALLYAQADGVMVNQIAGPEPISMQTVYAYSGSNLSYICWAKSIQPLESNTAISAASNAAAVSFTAAGHGFDTNSKPQITISGGEDAWAAVNGTWTATITGVDTFTIPVDSSALGEVAGTLSFSTRSPRKQHSVWSVKYFAYDGSGNLVWSGYASGASQKFDQACAAPTQYQ